MAWRYLFIDESGDSGEQSPFFVIGVVDLAADALVEMRRLLASLRYHHEMFREVKTSRLGSESRKRRQTCDLACHLFGRADVHCTVLYVDKQRYSGPYLGKTGKGVWPVRFRNFLTKVLLEKHFASHPIAPGTELDLVFDRVTMKVSERRNLESYLGGNRNLPKFTYFTHVDSEYADSMILPDLAVSLVKDFLSGVKELENATLARAQIACLDASSP